MRRRQRIWLAFLAALVLVSAGAAKAADDPPTDEGWLRRTLRRYFTDTDPSGAELGGRAVDLVSRYREHGGKRIAVVIVYPVERFDRDPSGAGAQFLAGLTRPLRTYTRESVVRNHLLFRRDEVLDPFAVADSERLLRDLDFISDVRLFVVPLEGEDDMVAVVVEVRDRWPFGLSGSTQGTERVRANLYHVNVAGLGVRFENEAIWRGDVQRDWGYRGRLHKSNMAGSFVTMNLDYEDSWRRLLRGVSAQRVLAHPGIRWIGGVDWVERCERDPDIEPHRYRDDDVWLGRVLVLDEGRGRSDRWRSVLVPGVRVTDRRHSRRPVVGPDLATRYHDRRDHLVGLTFSRRRNLKTSYLFRTGETENVDAGLTVKLSAGYQQGEFHKRSMAFLQTWYVSARERGDFWLLDARFGGYYRSRRFEDGALVVGTTYATPLMGSGRFGHRVLADLRYHLGVRRRGDGLLSLDDDTGVRDLEKRRLLGNQRLVLNLESRVFTPWSVFGFRMMPYAFADLGAVGDEEAAILQRRVYTSLGLGLRVDNPDLVVPAAQVRLALLSDIEGDGMSLSVEVGNVSFRNLRAPGPVPGGFEFR